ncbi:hypothetical protein [Azotobacter vinelandii]|uniref:hypothetical protein n=1 Tax=Azotobacter vinelandii TaxID=354 RepID=UPI000772FCD4|nr:hypothetical protein [Azotobacter vinelandii]WKN24351.1 hypothetical protein AVAEIV_002515 [Azotobacter vinelandii]
MRSRVTFKSHDLDIASVLYLPAVAPGAVMTGFIDSAEDVPAPEYAAMMKTFVDFLVPDLSKVTAPEQVAEVVYRAATDDPDQVRYIAGQDAQSVYGMRLAEGSEQFRLNLTKRMNSTAHTMTSDSQEERP